MSIDPSTTVGVFAGRRQAVNVHGPDAVDFLQGQLSQDVAALAPGTSAWSLVLHPQGKVSAWFRIVRTAHEAFVIDVDAGWADEVVTRLNRFKLRTDVEITVAPWECLTIVGHDADDVDVSVAFDAIEHDVVDTWAGVGVRDVFGTACDASALGLDPLDPGDLEALRIEAGLPRMGAELDESTIPAAAGIVDRSVSFTKGCYTGQELVARIDSRGNNVPRRLLGVVFADATAPAVGSDVLVEGDRVGTVTSSAMSTRLGAPVALAYIGRAVEAGQAVSVDSDDGVVTGELRALPLVGS